MMTITKCYIGTARTSAIALCDERFKVSNFIVSSFGNLQIRIKRGAGYLNVIERETEKSKSRFDKMLSRSNWTGLFENRRMTMKVHTFDLGDIVTVFQMSVHKGLMIEGVAAIVSRVDDVDEQYVVRFRGDAADDIYERFVDVAGQENPEVYVREINKKLNIAA